MKQIVQFFGLTLTVLFMVACSTNSFKVDGVAEGFDEGDTLLVIRGDKPEPLDTIIVKDNKFEWQGEADSVVFYVIAAPKANSSVVFFGEPGTVKIRLSADGNSEISGTKSNEALQEMNKLNAEFQKKVDVLMPKFSEDVDEEQQKALYEEYNKLVEEMQANVAELAKKNLDNELGFVLMSTIAYGDDFSTDELKELISKMPQEYQDRQAMKDILKMINDRFPAEEGDQIPNFSMQSPEDTEIFILDEVKKNKVTVLDFWASWCGPCRDEMPAMKKMLADYQEAGFGIVGISIDGNKEDWINCIKTLELTWPQMSDLKGGASPIAQSFGARFIPFTVVVDQQGKIYQMIVLREYHRWFERLRLFEIHQGIRDNDDRLTHLYPAGCSTVQTNTSTATFALDDIGLKTLSIIIIKHLYFLTSYQIGGIHQILIDGDATHIVQVSFCDLYTVQLGFHYFYHHISTLYI